jgi:hypothetical protein
MRLAQGKELPRGAHAASEYVVREVSEEVRLYRSGGLGAVAAGRTFPWRPCTGTGGDPGQAHYSLKATILGTLLFAARRQDALAP